MKTVSAVAVAAAVTLTGSGVIAAPASAATAISCGATVTGNAYLAGDLSCSGSGITITGDSTVDLRGHQLTGTSTSFGITILGAGAVQVRNGRLSNWRTAIVSGPPSDDPDPSGEFGSAVIDRVSLSHNSVGVDADGPLPGSTRSRDVLVKRSAFKDNTTGITNVFGAIRVDTSTFTGNQTAGTSITGSLIIRHSLLTGNQLGLNCDETGCLIEHNVLGNNRTGVSSVTYGATLRDNTFAGNTVAYASSSDWGGSEVTGNRFIKNGSGVVVGFFSQVTVSDNVFTRNTSAITSPDGPPDGEPDEFTTTATLTGNRFYRNQDAIYLLILARLKNNSAVNNTGWGIYAPNAVDLGGNTAHGNGRSPQCTGVSCG
jgi:hypothetical protein